MGLDPGACARHVTIAAHQSKESFSHPWFQNYNVRGLNQWPFVKKLKEREEQSHLYKRQVRILVEQIQR